MSTDLKWRIFPENDRTGGLDYAYQYDESGEHIIGVTGEGYGAVDLRNIAFDDDGNMYVYQSITGKVLKCNKIREKMCRFIRMTDMGL